MRAKFHIHAFRDDEAGVWVATSNDVPGLVAEADTVEDLLKKLRVLIPELLDANGYQDGENIPFEFSAKTISTTHHCPA